MHFIEARQIGFRRGRDVAALDGDGLFERLHARDLRLILGLILVVILLRNHALGDQAGPALRRDAGQLQVGFALLIVRERLLQRRLRLLHVGLGLANLLVEFRRFNFGHRLPGLDAVADVHHAALDVAVRARQDGSFGNRLDVAGQLQLTLA